MVNTDISFYGQQSGERILYVVRPYWLAPVTMLVKFGLAAGAVIMLTLAAGRQIFLSRYQFDIAVGGGTAAAVIAGAGLWITNTVRRKSVAYITDRRIVKFEATNPFATAIRSLSWEEAVKVKTPPTNFIWKQLMVGTVVVHAKTTVASTDLTKTENLITDDDVEVKHVYFYRDLANYIEKILFLYKKRPKEIAQLTPFVPRKKGLRY
jgi:hypothetical protein